MDDHTATHGTGSGATGIHAQLCDAIARRSLVMFEYADLMRVVEPHRYGINSLGHPMLSGWLRAGYSRSDPEGGWRNYLVTEISALEVLDAPFAGPRPGYAAHDSRMRLTYAELRGSPSDRQVNGPFVVRESLPVTPAPAPAPAPLIQVAPPEVTEQAQRALSADPSTTHDGEAEGRG